MPAKRRQPKRRVLTTAEELEAWDMSFKCGWNYLDFLRPLDLEGDPRTDSNVRDACRAAWQRLGAQYMAAWQPEEGQALPWAMLEFGAPNGWRP